MNEGKATMPQQVRSSNEMTALRVISSGDMTAPCLCIDVDISSESVTIPAQRGPLRAKCAWLLISVHTEVVGSLIIEVPPEGLTAPQIHSAVKTRFADSTRRIEPRRPRDGSESAYAVEQFATPERNPEITVVVCTRERPDGLQACLRSLLAQSYTEFSIIVVDNAPVTERTKFVVEQLDSPIVLYLVEQKKGLSWARNKALEVLDTPIVAWIDDDETADPHWLAELARALHDHPEADSVSGVMVPGELETWPQVWFEQYGGHIKHRGFTPAVFSPATARIQSPLYPLPQFGTGGNMAVRTEALKRIGGFDVALGAGSFSMASEDTRMFTDILCAGGTVVYQPTAVTRHFHRRSIEELRQQMLGYGVGLTAFYTSLVINHPRCIPQLIRLLPVGYRDLFGSKGLQSGNLPLDFPAELLRMKRLGMFKGPFSYLRSRFAAGRYTV